jgi:hypothetical protein
MFTYKFSRQLQAGSDQDTAKPMNLQEFETQYRSAVDTALNQLQTVNLLASQIQIRMNQLDIADNSSSSTVQMAAEIENQVLQIGRSLQNLSLTVEALVREQ